jgi:hypothetical protein
MACLPRFCCLGVHGGLEAATAAYPRSAEREGGTQHWLWIDRKVFFGHMLNALVMCSRLYSMSVFRPRLLQESAALAQCYSRPGPNPTCNPSTCITKM